LFTYIKTTSARLLTIIDYRRCFNSSLFQPTTVSPTNFALYRFEDKTKLETIS